MILSRNSKPEGINDDLMVRGQATYCRDLASILEPSHDGEFVAVEPDSGQYFLGHTASAALVAAHAAIPNKLFYLTRVGRETAHTLKRSRQFIRTFVDRALNE